jgi:hypothetical protein
MLDVAIANNLSDTDFQEDAEAKSRVQAAQQTRILRARQYAAAFAASYRTATSITINYPSPAIIGSPPNLDYGGFVLETAAQAVFNAIQRLYLNQSSLRDRRIAERLTTLYRDALAEGEKMLAGSVRQLADFLINHTWVGLPKITLTPDGTLRARWIAGPGNFTAIEFTGTALVKLVAEVPRGDTTAQYFASELVSNVARVARDLGAPFA